MSEQTDLHLILSRALHTDELSLEHDTMVISPELTKQVTDALTASTVLPDCSRAPAACLGSK